jgi:hypothetical protein
MRAGPTCGSIPGGITLTQYHLLLVKYKRNGLINPPKKLAH